MHLRASIHEGRDEAHSYFTYHGWTCPRRDTGRVMSEEFTTPNLVELTRRRLDAGNRRDVDALISLCAPDADGY
jgi:hypothetical protein